MSAITDLAPRLSHANQDRALRFRKARRIEKVLSSAGFDLAASRVLDIGTGSGTIAAYLAPRVRTLVSVDVVDERTDRNFEYMRIADERLPFADGSFDVAISNHVIEHVGDRQRHLSEIARILSPGGVCLMATPNRYWPIEPHFDLPVLAWLPTRWLRDRYVRLAGKGKRYDVDLCTPGGLSNRAIVAGLTAKDASFALTKTVLGEKAGPLGRLVQLIQPVWPALRPALPSIVVLLERPGTLALDSANVGDNLSDPVKRFRRQNYFLSAWRVGSFLHRRRVPILPTAWRIACQVVFHADVPMQVRIPRDVVFMHNGLGTVIHTNVEFRGAAIVYHNVTIGMSHRIEDGAPVIGKNVLIGANSVILGPVEIGDSSIIAAGAVVTKSVPSGQMAIGNPAVLKPANLEILQSLFGRLEPAPSDDAREARAA